MDGHTTRKVKFDVVLEPEATYYPITKELLRLGLYENLMWGK
jgi:hypothetical protein